MDFKTYDRLYGTDYLDESLLKLSDPEYLLDFIQSMFKRQHEHKIDEMRVIAYFRKLISYITKAELSPDDIVEFIYLHLSEDPLRDKNNKRINKAYVRKWVNKLWKLDYYWKTVSRGIKSNRYEFIFQQPCINPGNVSEVIEIAKSINLPTNGKTKRDICTSLTDFIDQQPDCNLEETDPYSMEPINEIPPYRRYRIGNHCFDLFSLASSIDSGVTTNPYTRKELPVNDIRDHFKRITKLAISKNTLIDDVRNTSLNDFTKDRLQKQKFTQV